ncbi:HAD hydrolase-like protein [Phreatobacter sp.]|uniref:HAD hydrolase-like protein n=1 Tax=Phreatobacter sp. TaxID=1966341 RepID=UPI003F72DB86
MEPIRLVLFDFDGTIADSEAWFSGKLNQIARHFGFRETGPEEREKLRGLSSRQIISELGVPVWKLPLIAAHMRGLASRDIEHIAPFPWVDDLFHRLAAAGTVIAIVSSNTEANIRRVLGPAAAHVSAFGAGVSLFGKAARFRTVLKNLGVPPGATVAVGDEVRDIEAARKAGIASVAAGWGFATAEALKAAGPDAFASDVAALEAILLGRTARG